MLVSHMTKHCIVLWFFCLRILFLPLNLLKTYIGIYNYLATQHKCLLCIYWSLNEEKKSCHVAERNTMYFLKTWLLFLIIYKEPKNCLITVFESDTFINIVTNFVLLIFPPSRCLQRYDIGLLLLCC